MKVTTTTTIDFECLNKEVLSRDQGLKRIKEINKKYELEDVCVEYYNNKGEVEASFIESVEDAILLPRIKFLVAKASNPVKDDGFCYTNYVTILFKKETIEIYYFEDIQTPRKITGFSSYTEEENFLKEICPVIYDENLQEYIVDVDNPVNIDHIKETLRLFNLGNYNNDFNYNYNDDYYDGYDM